jgi:hypothetical protein
MTHPYSRLFFILTVIFVLSSGGCIQQASKPEDTIIIAGFPNITEVVHNIINHSENATENLSRFSQFGNVTSFNVSAGFPLFDRSKEFFALSDLYQRGITSYAGQKMFLKTKIRWTYKSLCYVNEENASACTPTVVGPANATVVFDDIRKYQKLGPEAFYSRIADFPLISENLETFNTTHYLFKNRLLSNDGKFYVLEGVLSYQPSLNVTKDTLQNQTFIELSKNPSFWPQTFEFELLDVYEY